MIVLASLRSKQMARQRKLETAALMVAFSVGISSTQLPPGRGRVMQIRGQGLEVVATGGDDLAKCMTTSPRELRTKTPRAGITTLCTKPY
jgi:hypothetical protein